jgi:hypothetical protein
VCKCKNVILECKLFQEWREGGIKESGEGGEFKYDMFDRLYEVLEIPQCTPTKHNNLKKTKQNIATIY